MNAKTPTMEKAKKTHWLQNPNKNYLGHQDLPNGDDIIVTITSGNWEMVKDPTRGSEELKRIIRFKEQDVKPLICNETNSAMISQVTNTDFIEDAIGKKIQLYVAKTKFMRKDVPCLRIRDIEIEDAPFDNSEAIKKLNDCKDITKLQTVFLSLSHKEKADKEVITLKDNLKIKLGKN